MKKQEHRNTQEKDKNLAKAQKQGKKVVLGFHFDVSSLPKDIRRAIYEELLPK